MPKQEEEKKGGIPAWVVSFTDMVTLLLAFFVLLQAFAHEQNPDLFYEGQGSFQRAIKGLGLPMWLEGKRPSTARDWFVKRYTTETDPMDPGDDIEDEEEEKLQRAFQNLKEQIDNDAQDLPRPIRVETLATQFSGESADLNDDLKKELDNLLEDLGGLETDTRQDMYIIGLAPDWTRGNQGAWVLSSQRAWAAEQYIRERMAGRAFNWSIHAIGAGDSFGTFPEGVQLGWVIMGDHDNG